MTESMIDPHDAAVMAEVESRDCAHPDVETLRRIHAAVADTAPKAQPIDANCLSTYRARRTSGKRPLSAITLNVIHCTQGPSAVSAAAWFANDAAQGSAHRCVDDEVCYVTLDPTDVPWGAPGANYHGMHHEMAGYVSWSSVLWSSAHRTTLRRCAYKVAFDCRRFGIPAVWLDEDALRRGASGITDHLTCTKVFGGTHTDPGPNFPRPLFMRWVRSYYNGMAHVRRAN